MRRMKKNIVQFKKGLFIIFFLIGCFAYSQNTYSRTSCGNGASNKDRDNINGTLSGRSESELSALKFKDGKFKIIQFTDLHWIKGKEYESANDSTRQLMSRLIKSEHPDLVIITGDVVVSGGAAEGWKEVTQPMVEAKVPFAVTFGNHDAEADITTLQALDILKTIPYNVTYNADNNISGVGNCTLPIKSSDGSQDKWVLYLFDSHDYPRDKTFGCYDWIKHDQIDWYRNQSESYTKKSGRILPSLAFFHIPLPEYTQTLYIAPFIGNKKEDVCSPNINSGLFSSFIEKKDILGVFVGHDHNDDYLVDANGKIALAYGRKTGYSSAYKEILERGGRVINLYEDDRSYNTYIETWSDKLNNYTFEQKGQACSYPIAEGTFIQESLVANWDDTRWQQELKLLKDVGMNYLIFAPAMLTDKKEKNRYLYPSSFSSKSEKTSKDLIDICLRNAKKCGLKVFIGLNFNDRWWSVDYTPGWLYKQMEGGNKIADELISLYKKKYGDTMYGWYWVWEVDNLHATTAVNQEILANALNINLDHLNKVTPDMPFMLSPYVNHKVGTADENRKMWESVFSQTHFKNGDIFSPQDCVGAGGLDVEKLPEWFGKMRQAVNTKNGLKFWANVETFDHRFWTNASLTRFKEQMEAVDPYVYKIITFAYSHYYSPFQVNKLYHDAYVEYYKTGKLPRLSVSEPVSNLEIKIKNEGAVILKWKSPKDKSNLMGYYVYKDGVLVANIQNKNIDDIKTEFIDKNGYHNNLYEVSSYNAIGEESIKVKTHM